MPEGPNLEGTPDGPFIVPKPEHERGGVDYLGLRQVNLDLMAECLPGINNTTRHIRPYSVLCWIHWKYHRALVERRSKNAQSRELRRFQEKAETLFTWGHQLRGLRGIPGTLSKCPPAEGGWVELAFSAWKRSARNTSLQAPVQYGPSLKSPYGLGFAEPVSGGMYHVTPAGEAMAKALDARLRRSSGYDLVSDLAERRGRARDAEELLKSWRVDEISQAERDQFREVFSDEDKVDEDSVLGTRSATVAAILETLRTARAGLDEEEIRQSLARQRVPGGRRVKLTGNPAANARKWLVLQVRQAQRAALEGLLFWCESKILNGTRSVQELQQALRRCLAKESFSKGGRATCAATLSSFQRPFGTEDAYHEACAKESNRSFFSLTDELLDTPNDDEEALVAAVSKVLVATIALTAWLKEAEAGIQDSIAHGKIERVSLGYQHEHFRRFWERPFADFVCDILERWVISQHLSVATRRSDGRNQRLRFTFDELGLEFLAERPMGVLISADHLNAALSLMAECELVGYDPEKDIYTSLH